MAGRRERFGDRKEWTNNLTERARERQSKRATEKKKKKHERREQKSAKGINSKMKKNSLDVSERTEVK